VRLTRCGLVIRTLRPEAMKRVGWATRATAQTVERLGNTCMLGSTDARGATKMVKGSITS